MSSLISCNNKNVKDRTDQEIDSWYSKSKWNDLSMKPDKSINKRLFVEQNLLNPKAWDTVFNFFKEKDLNKLELGRYELTDGAYINVQEYLTKDSSHFEAHRKFIDIQYLSRGREYIYVSLYSRDEQTEVTTYNEEQDIEFFDKKTYEKYLLDSDNFLVLFPIDGHMPCMKVDSNENVRKIVAKIPYVE
jgi:YhcH/YjgK/YiaL family protein